jgi:hypothetical protein
MKKTSIITISAIALFLSFISSTAFAQDAEYNLIRRTYKVNNDGSLDISYRKEIKLIRNRAITAYADKGETFILYNPAIDNLTINESYTIRPDGSRVQTPANAFIDQLPSQCENCGRYNGIRERAVIHTALEYNCVVVLDYTIHRKSTILDEEIILSEDCPVKKYEVIFDTPESRGNYDVNFSEWVGSKKIKVLKDGHTFHCVANNLTQTYNDSYLPDALYPTIHLSFKPKTPDFVCGTGTVDLEAKIGSAAAYLIGELHDNNPLTYVTNIRDYVIDNIRTTDFPMSLVNYEISSPTETFFTACGTPADKEWLILALIREAGFKASKQDNRIVVTVNENGKDMDYILSTTDKRPPRIDGAAIDEQRTIERNETIPWSGNTIGNGYAQMELPMEKGSININPARLTSDRKAPVKVRNCNEKYHYTIMLPRTPKRVLVGEPVNIEYTKKGIGSIKISISQNPGGGIEVTRELNIDVENGIVTQKQYKAFRKMMQDWNEYRTITVKTELSQHFGL